MRKSLLLLALLSLSARAEFSIPGFELIHTVPVQTQLATPDLRSPTPVWCQLFDGAKHSIDIAQFYASGKPGEPLDQVMAHLKAAGKRGVKIRFLMDKHGLRASEQSTLDALKAIPNLEFRLIDYGKVGGGIIHAKYFVIDGKEGYLGSQNFDWRSLKHIHEAGLLISDAKVAGQMQAIFDIDWQAQKLLAEGKPVPVQNQHKVLADESQGNYLVASPNAFNPPGVGDSESELPKLLAKAKKEVLIQVMEYAPLSYAPGIRPYYAVIDDAIRATAQRGVKVKLMVADWNTQEPELSYLKSLAVLPNVEVKVVTLPQAKEGFIPYARVIHTKTMDIDDQIAWLGTSNWEGGYLDNSRNLEMVMQDAKMAKRLGELHRQLWDSPYAKAIDLDKAYPRPHPGTEH
ncbi:phospholipase D-like domain-containing protein [Gallaecimonas kandeliae]|uniref:phospholipase D-like domain-containing protein n=1 Tax=Gallaecimonas kandeliae TaxID=3029055 RepID=UPI0026472A84|nr:phospholipase D-like domain-containing protein [Gallaecimonas kandeliae]WKE67019.1 phospholipase D-like domain-containing protein [Gallaecimonas kandeliae]